MSSNSDNAQTQNNTECKVNDAFSFAENANFYIQ